MGEIIVGLLAVAVGFFFCFSGNLAMRIMFPFIGFFMGFSAGAGFISQATGDGFLSTAMGWVVGFFIGLLLGLLAYFFYEVAVALVFAGLGFALTSAFLSMLNLDWNWLVVIAGTFVGVIFGLTALYVKMPMLLLILATSFWGAAVIVYGLMLVLNISSLGDFSSGRAWLEIRNSLGLYLLWLFFAISGGIGQVKLMSKEAEFSRKYWEKSKTFEDYVNVK